MAKVLDTSLDDHRLINSKQLKRIIPVSTAVVKRWEAAGHFPQSLKLGPGGAKAKSARNFWRLSDVVAFLAANPGFGEAPEAVANTVASMEGEFANA